MKTAVACTLLLLGSLGATQSITDLPLCSIQCVASAVTGVGCGLTDYACSCQKSDQLTPTVTACVKKACPSPADQAKVITVLEGICAAAGFPIKVPPPQPETSQQPQQPQPSETPKKGETPASSHAPTIQTSVPAETPLPTGSCVVKTITKTVTKGKPEPTPSAPYPTGPVGTGTPIVPSSPAVNLPPEFTGAASAVKVPAGVAGFVGLVAYFL
ncbi:uncharacterized protein EI97DRAFT_499162 [Westerdykella ornata]|uniref:CFEM domain-containing protein n=1 Tax=Westerdykella ornata TaxID=318751 RepID=A0A6A6JVF5_WESOR|nr:uncharacterized protein EI97DRAFT_499162 [Westerdykella ornata]KAF2279798.1 hypothetical protein EI97DRAFT_499162 [Westerdykella ornata]